MTLRDWREVFRRAAGRGTYPHQLAFLLENPLRSLVFSRRQLLERLAPRANWRVLELGPGPGYFSAAVARRLARGRLELYDLQREMLARARRKLARAALSNVGYVQGDGRWLPYRDGVFDGAFLVAVLGEVPDPAACLRELCRVLRPGGVLSVTELPGDPDHVPAEELERLARDAGLIAERRFGRARTYTATFCRPAVRADERPTSVPPGADLGALAIEESPAARDVAFLEERIVEYNYARTGIRDGRELALFVRADDGAIRAGLYGWTWGDCCEIRFLWVADALRGRGVGTALLAAAESEARRRGARQVVLDSHSFQAPGFYRRHGYEEVGRQPGYPRGHAKFFFRKRLEPLVLEPSC